MDLLSAEGKRWVSKGSVKQEFPAGQQVVFRLFCFPFLGGGATSFAPWIQTFAEQGVDVLPIAYPGREDRDTEPAIDDPFQLMHEACEAVLPILRDDRVPWGVYGHSMGTWMGYLFVMVAMRKHHLQPALCALGAGRPLHLATKSATMREVHAAGGKKQTRQQLLTYLKEVGLEASVLNNKAVMEFLEPKCDNDMSLLVVLYARHFDKQHEFVGEAFLQPIPCPLIWFHGMKDTLLNRSYTSEQLHEWKRWTTDRLEAVMLPGAPHLFIKDRVLRASVWQRILAEVAKVTTTRTGDDV